MRFNVAEKFNLKNFFTEVKEELEKVSWPTREQTIKTTAVVLIAVVIVTIYLGVADGILSAISKRIIG